MRFKHFAGKGSELEEWVNSWLVEFEPDVRLMAQTAASDGTVSVSFLFEESFRGQERRLASEHGVPEEDEPPVPADRIPDRPIVVPQEPGQIARDAGL